MLKKTPTSRSFCFRLPLKKCSHCFSASVADEHNQNHMQQHARSPLKVNRVKFLRAWIFSFFRSARACSLPSIHRYNWLVFGAHITRILHLLYVEKVSLVKLYINNIWTIRKDLFIFFIYNCEREFVPAGGQKKNRNLINRLRSWLNKKIRFC